MKLIISYDEIKREFDGNFSICGSREDLTILKKEIENQLNKEGFSYGWIEIITDRPKITANQVPIDWKQGA